MTGKNIMKKTITLHVSQFELNIIGDGLLAEINRIKSAPQTSKKHAQVARKARIEAIEVMLKEMVVGGAV